MRALLGAVVGGALMVTGAIERGSALPFGVFLALGGVFTLFLGQDVWGWYLRFVRGT
jgi:prepilin signal peptidase PulO-like enzyme (type II secretory pathway)